MVSDLKYSNMKISIITVTWNCAQTLPDCFASVAQQTFLKKQHVIVDGASTDGTVDVIKQHISHDAVFISEPDRGIYDALNKGLKLATGDVVGFLHADDFYTSNDVLEKVSQAFENPEVCAVYGDLQYVRKNDIDNIIRRWKSNPFERRDLAWGWMPAHPTLYVRRELYERIGGFRTDFRISADYLSILQLFTQPDFNAVYLPEGLVTMRLGGASNKSLRSLVRKTSEDWRALHICGFSFAGALRAIIWKNIGKISQFLNI